MLNIDFLCERTIVIPRLPCLFSMAKADYLTVEPVKSVTSDCVNWSHCAMSAFAGKGFPIELVPCSGEWWTTWWQMIHMMSGLPVSSIAQCKNKCHDGACLELYQPIECFEPTFIESNIVSNMICKVSLRRSRTMTRAFLEDIIPLSNNVFKDVESNCAVAIWKLCNSTSGAVTGYIMVM